LCYFQGRQEDAEEFLGFLLNGLHEELALAMKKIPNSAEENLDPNASLTSPEWVEVGHKNRPLSVRRVSI